MDGRIDWLASRLAHLRLLESAIRPKQVQDEQHADKMLLGRHQERQPEQASQRSRRGQQQQPPQEDKSPASKSSVTGKLAYSTSQLQASNAAGLAATLAAVGAAAAAFPAAELSSAAAAAKSDSRSLRVGASIQLARAPRPTSARVSCRAAGRLNRQLATPSEIQLLNVSLVPTRCDALACVTATYLCVLIVNNTWFDCLAMANPVAAERFTVASGQPSSQRPSAGQATPINPLDITLLLYTHQHRMLAASAASGRQRHLSQPAEVESEGEVDNEAGTESESSTEPIARHPRPFLRDSDSAADYESHQDLNVCRFRCPTGANEQPAVSLLAYQQNEPAPSNQLVASSTLAMPIMSSGLARLPASTVAGSQPATNSVAPSAKMNILDITFLLYTRQHRILTSIGATGPLDYLSHLGQDSNEARRSISATSSVETSQLFLGPGELLDPTNETTLLESQFNSSLPVKVIIHGFGSGGRRPWVTDMVSKLLDYEDVNVIVVDWEKGATLPNYVQAAGNTRLVGHRIACLIRLISAKYGLSGNSYHLIGFSLGAHVAGFAGMEIRNSTNEDSLWIDRITGLDPASPLFEGYEANDRLDPSDAQFVDVIHSNGDGVLRGGFGSLQPMGHVDFYPNGGRVQVGCNSVLLSAISDIIYGKWQSLCNHRRALNFFMDSFEFDKCRFRSFSCDSYENYLRGECFDCGHNNEKCSYMGYMASYSKGRGKMYLTTHEEAPFCANQYLIKIVGSKGFKTHWGKVEVTLVTSDGRNESFWLSSMSREQSNIQDQQSYPGASASFNSNSGQNGASSGLGSSQKELSLQLSMQSLIVAHTALVNLTQVLLKYSKYKGWIYSGDESWSIDKVFLTDSDGQVKSYCGSNTILENHVTTRLNLDPGNCTIVEPTKVGNTISTASSTANLSGANQQAQRDQSAQIVKLPVARQQQSMRGSGLFASAMIQQQPQSIQQIQQQSQVQQQQQPSSQLQPQQQQQQQQASQQQQQMSTPQQSGASSAATILPAANLAYQRMMPASERFQYNSLPLWPQLAS